MKDQYPPYQAKVINIWENMTEWALNGFNLPLVGHSGDADNQIPSIPGPDGYPNVPNRGQLESSIRIREQLAKEGFPSEGEPNRMVAKGTPDLFLISANTGHGTSPAVRDQINAFLKEAVDKGQVSPDHIKFLTYTTRYNKDYWVTVEGMTRLYERADIDARRSNAGKNYEITTHNIARLALRETRNAAEIKIDGQTLTVTVCSNATNVATIIGAGSDPACKTAQITGNNTKTPDGATGFKLHAGNTNGTATITVKANLNNVQSTSAVVLRFTGDLPRWPGLR